MKLSNAILSLMLVAGLAACGGSKEKSTTVDTVKLEGSIRIDGSSTVFPITEAVAEEYRAVQPDVKVTIGVSGTGGGFKKFARKETDISDASRPIKDKEIKLCEEAGIKYQELTVAYDGLAVIINPENDWAETITVAELKKIWEPAAQETITKWNQIRPEWPNETIELYGPGLASGTYDYFTEAIIGESGASRGDFNASEDDNILVKGVAGNKYAIGFFGLAYYEENKTQLKLVGVDNGNGPVKPTLETVSSNEYAPLSRPIFIYVSKESAARPEVKSFVEFYLENAPVLSEEIGYVALPKEKYDEQKAKFAEFVK